MPDIFLSYSRDDQATARRFAEGFEREGFSVWWDQTLSAGEAYDEVTERALNEAKAVVVLWSKTSVGSRWVRAEATQALESKTLVPVMIEPCKRPIMFELTHTADLSHWRGDAHDKTWQSYLADVRRFVEKGEPARAVVLPVVRRSRRGSLRVAIPVAVLLIAGVVLWSLSRTSGERTASSPAPAATAPPGVTLAVLPFADMSPAHDQEYFSDGLSEELLNQLAQIKDLRVSGRTSSFSFKGKNEDLRVIGQRLGVANLLEGSVRKDGTHLRITAQLNSSKDGTHLWSKTYDRELSGVFALQEEIAKDVARALSIKLDVGEMSRARGGTTNLEAYDKYLQAEALLSRKVQREGMLKVNQLLREAVALDPAFVRAWAELASALLQTIVWAPENTAALQAEASDAEARVLALMPDSLDGQSVRLGQLVEQHKWSEAEATARTVTRDPEGFGSDSGFLLSVGRIQEVLPYVERWRQVNPLSLALSGSVQMILDMAGRRADAQAEYERSRDLAGDHSLSEFLAFSRFMARKDADRATIKARIRAYLEHENATQPLVLDASLADRLDDPGAARAAIRKAFEDPANQESQGIVEVAMYADMFGDRDLALAALRHGLVDLRGDVSLLWFPFQSGLRADPRFKDILRDLGLVDYYRASGKWPDFCKPAGKDDFECR